MGFLALQVLLLRRMKRVLSILLLGFCLAMSSRSSAATADPGLRSAGVHTNWVDRWITNTAEIHMQLNRFVTEFHTNWVRRIETNYVDLFTTNVVTAYHTNWVNHFRTNVLDRFATNLVTRLATNIVVVDSVRTNFVQGFRTNLVTLNLTNWTTVIAFKTNWVNKPLTNLVQIDMAGQPALPSSNQPVSNEQLALQAFRGSGTTVSNQVEVHMKVTWAHGAGSPVRVQQWRVEREDGSILCFGQDLEFKRALPQGTYKVTVRAQRDANSPLLAALGTLTVTPKDVSLEQRPARSNSSI
jgi:hypothetical protein